MASGATIGKYRVVRELGRGGMGITYEAEPLDGGAHVAIKEIVLSRVDDWKILELFEREARVLANVTHPAVPRYVDHFSVERPDGPAFYLVQELASGRSLHDLVVSGWRADEAEARRIAEALLDVLDYLHARMPPVYHRDVKPQNVLRDDTGKVWLVDFGAVRDVYKTTAGGSTVAGTFGYMAPEQLRGIARPESDLHGVGATLLFLLSGQSPADMPQRRLKVDFRSRVAVSAPFAAWLEKMLEPAPEDRFQSARAALVALRSPSVAVAGGAPRKLRVRVLLGVLASLIAVLAGLGIATLRQASVKRAALVSAAAKLPTRPVEWRLPVISFVRSIPAHMTAVTNVTFTPDGTRVLSTSFDGTAKVWDAKTGAAICALPGHSGKVFGVSVTPDGRHVVTGGDHTVRIWSLPGCKAEGVIETSSPQVYAVAVSPNGQTVAAALANGTVGVWTLEGAPITTLAHGRGRVGSVAFSPDGANLLSAGDDKVVSVWGVADWKRHLTLSGHTATVDEALVAPDGQLIASAADDHTVRLWQMTNGISLATLSRNADELWTIAFSPDGSTLVSGGKEPLLNVWSMPSTGLRQQIPLSAGQSTLGMAFSADGKAFATATSNGTVYLWRVAKSGAHGPLPTVQPLPAARPPSGTPEERQYAAAMELALEYSGNKKPLDDAEALLRAMLLTNPRSALAFAGLSRVEFKRGFRSRDDYDPALLAKALEDANRAIALDPKLAEAYVSRGWAAYESKDAAGAREAAATALKLDPVSPRALLFGVTLAQDDVDLDRAERMIRDLLSRPIDPRQAVSALDELEEVYFTEGDFDGAEACYQKVIGLDPGSAWAKGNYAGFLIRKGDADTAITLVKQALSQMQYGAGRRTLAEAYCAKGEALLWDRSDPDGAQASFASAIAADPKYERATFDTGAYHQYLGVTRKDSAQLAQARSSYRAALDLDPSDTSAKGALAALGE